MRTELYLNMFHVATKRLYQEIEQKKLPEEKHIYRATEQKLKAMISFFGLSQVVIQKSKKIKTGKYYYQHFIIVPFNLDKVFDKAIKIRRYLVYDRQNRKKLVIKLFRNSKEQDLQQKYEAKKEGIESIRYVGI